MAILGSVPVSGFVAPTSESDTYPSHKAKYGHGGHRSVADLIERDAINTSRREIGMTVWVISTSSEYRLEGDIDNTSWVIVSGGGTGLVSISFICGQDIAKNRVCVVINDVLYYADKDNVNHIGLTKYFSTSAGLSGSSINVIEEGQIVDVAFTFTANTSYFLLNTGNIGEASSISSGFLQKIGVAESSTKIYFDPKIPIKL